MTRVTIENLAFTLPAVEPTRRATSNQVDAAPPFDDHLRRAGEQVKPLESEDRQQPPPRNDVKPAEQAPQPSAQPARESAESSQQDDSQPERETDAPPDQDQVDPQFAATTLIVAAEASAARVDVAVVADGDVRKAEISEDNAPRTTSTSQSKGPVDLPAKEVLPSPVEAAPAAGKGAQRAESNERKDSAEPEQKVRPVSQSEGDRVAEAVQATNVVEADQPEIADARKNERTARSRRGDNGTAAKTSETQGSASPSGSAAPAAKAVAVPSTEATVQQTTTTKADSSANAGAVSTEALANSEVVVAAPTGDVAMLAGTDVKGGETAVREGGKGAIPRAERSESTGHVDGTRFVQRVSRAFHALGEDGGQLRLRLSPPELGSLRLEVTLRDGVLTAKLEAETAAARTVLVESLPQLRERLAEQGIQIERFDVDLMNQSSTGSRDQFAGDEQDRQRFAGSARGSSTTNANETTNEPRRGGRASGTSELDVVI